MSNIPQEDHINKEHIKNLISVAMADGRIDDLELEILQDKAEELGIESEELDVMMASLEDVPFAVPTDTEDKENFLSEFVFMMMVNGDIHPVEYDLCMKFARELDFRESDLDKIIELSKQLWKSSNA